MHILMLSIDKGLLGQGQLGDVVQRHKKYGQYCDKLDIIVLNKIQSQLVGVSKPTCWRLSDKVTVYPTNSCCKLAYYFNALKIGKKIFQRVKYDLIVCQTPFITGLVGYKLKKKYKTKLLVHFHGDFKWLLKWPFKWPFLSELKNTNGIRVMSAGQKEKLVQKGIDGSKIRIISTPVDIERFENYGKKEEQKELMRNLLNMQKDKKFILMVARKHPIKDLNTLYRVLDLVYNKNKEIGLWLVGGGYIYSEEIKNLPKNMQLILTGKIDSIDLPAYYKTSYLTVLCSKSESFGKILVEANACGKPVVATTTTGAKEIIQDGYNGFLVPIGDAEKMAEKILYLLNNPEKAKEMGENGRNLAKKKYSGNIKKIIQFWTHIANFAS